MTADDSAPVPPSSPTQPSKPTVQPPQRPPYAPPFLWRLGSVAVVGLTGLLSRTFLLTCTAKFETHGLDGFLQLLDERKEPETRTRGLITGLVDVGLCCCSRIMLMHTSQSRII